jgi:hypothetical protein
MQITLQSSEDINSHIENLHISAEEAQLQLSKISGYANPLELLYKIKFERIGFDPLNQQRSLNLIEQVNQTFTYLASFRAASLLFSWHSALDSLTLNLGARSGTDIKSNYDGGIAAEVFAAVTPHNNNKIIKDIEKVTRATAVHKYVFFMCPDIDRGPYSGCRAPEGIKIWSLGNEY